jgi:hypothetical protein
MAVSNVTTASGSGLSSLQPARKPPVQQQDAAVVKLSAQAQQLNRNEGQNRAETRPAVASAILQAVNGQSKGNNVDTYA